MIQSFSIKPIQKSFSQVAWIYDLWAKITETRAAAKALKWSNIQGDETILEVALGTGLLFERIVRLNPDGLYLGLDISSAMLKRAYHRLEKFGENLFNLQIANAYQLPYKDSVFDLLNNNYMLDLLPEANFWIRLLPKSTTYTIPFSSTATSVG